MSLIQLIKYGQRVGNVAKNGNTVRKGLFNGVLTGLDKNGNIIRQIKHVKHNKFMTQTHIFVPDRYVQTCELPVTKTITRDHLGRIEDIWIDDRRIPNTTCTSLGFQYKGNAKKPDQVSGYHYEYKNDKCTFINSFDKPFQVGERLWPKPKK